MGFILTGKELKRARQERNLTIVDLYNITGISISILKLVEDDKYEFESSEIFSLMYALGSNIEITPNLDDIIPLNENASTILIDARKEKNLSLLELGYLANVQPVILARIECSLLNSCKIRALINICHILDINYNEMISK